VLLGGVAERLPEQVLLGGEVVEDQPGGDPEGGGDVADPGAGEAAGDHLTAGRPENLLPADVRLDARHGGRLRQSPTNRLAYGAPSVSALTPTSYAATRVSLDAGQRCRFGEASTPTPLVRALDADRCSRSYEASTPTSYAASVCP